MSLFSPFCFWFAQKHEIHKSVKKNPALILPKESHRWFYASGTPTTWLSLIFSLSGAPSARQVHFSSFFHRSQHFGVPAARHFLHFSTWGTPAALHYSGAASSGLFFWLGQIVALLKNFLSSRVFRKIVKKFFKKFFKNFFNLKIF